MKVAVIFDGLFRSLSHDKFKAYIQTELDSRKNSNNASDEIFVNEDGSQFESEEIVDEYLTSYNNRNIEWFDKYCSRLAKEFNVEVGLIFDIIKQYEYPLFSTTAVYNDKLYKSVIKTLEDMFERKGTGVVSANDVYIVAYKTPCIPTQNLSAITRSAYKFSNFKLNVNSIEDMVEEFDFVILRSNDVDGIDLIPEYVDELNVLMSLFEKKEVVLK